MSACVSGFDEPNITFYRKTDTTAMSTEAHTSPNLKRSHVAEDEASDDDQELISNAALESPAYYTKGLHITPFSTMQRLKTSIDTLSKRLASGETETQYYAFSGVPKEIVDRADKEPSLLGHGTRITYFYNEEVMIVKLVSVLHDVTHAEFGDEVKYQVFSMGIPRRAFISTLSGRMYGRDSSKEGDSSYKPLPARRLHNDWPTIVIEAGYSQNRRSLRNAARWWLSNSNRNVNIVILISIYQRSKTLELEKWCNRSIIPRRSSRQQGPGNSPVITPSLITTVTVSHISNTPVDRPTSYNVAGPTLILEFDKLLLRAPVHPERDISLGATELQEWAARVWSGTM